MKRILVVFLMLAIILAGCSNKGEKYQKDIDKVYKEQNQMNKIASKYKTLLKQTLNKKTVIHMFIKMVKSLLLVFNYIKIVKKCIISHMK